MRTNLEVAETVLDRLSDVFKTMRDGITPSNDDYVRGMIATMRVVSRVVETERMAAKQLYAPACGMSEVERYLEQRMAAEVKP